ncbi:MAG: diguanylate cyclase, partial [Pyrinomonadaceae bacterium]
ARLLATSALHRPPTVVDSIEIQTEPSQIENAPLMAARLVHEDEPFGVILLIRDVDRAFDAVEINELESVALFAAAGIHRARMQLRSQESALVDPFMQLPNHRAACGILDQRIAESLRFRNREPVAVISLNLGDDEDRSGLDSELKTLCPIIAAQLRQMDILARGDRNELLIVLPRATRAEANLVAERIQRALESHSLPTKPNAHFGMGIGAFPRDGETASEILARARTDVRPDDLDLHDSTANVVPLDRWR